MKKLLPILAVILLSSCSAPAVYDWAPAGDRIRTEWASQVTPDNAREEYPRPQMVREGWKNLNGLWDYAITADSVEMMNEADSCSFLCGVFSVRCRTQDWKG